jgi:hypothetical protein
MSVTRISTVRPAHNNFEPEVNEDPHAQRRVRGQLEQIDYTAFAANRAAISLIISGGHVSAAKFQRLAVATAQARAYAEAGKSMEPGDTARLLQLRETFVELSAAYEGLRRMVERGYLTMDAATLAA